MREIDIYRGGVHYMIQEIIDKFKEYMKLKNLSQGAAAELIKISRPHLNKILNSRTAPSMKVLMKMEEIISK